MKRHRSMPKLILAVITILVSIVCLSLVAFAQNAPSQPAAGPRYVLLEYMKIEPGKGADYRKVEQEIWMPIHRERIKAKLIVVWRALPWWNRARIRRHCRHVLQ